MVMRRFSVDERAWLASQRLGRLATVSPDGVVGNAPVTYFVRGDDAIDIGGMRMGATRKFRNVQAGSAWPSSWTSWTPLPAGIRSTSRSAVPPRRCPTSSLPPTGSPERSSASTPTGSGRSTFPCRGADGPRAVGAEGSGGNPDCVGSPRHQAAGALPRLTLRGGRGRRGRHCS